MPLTTQSVPHLREPEVAEKKTEETTPEPAEVEAKPVKAKAEPRKLGRASESGDAGVHNLLAQRTIHASNGDDARVAEIDATLADLGLAV